MSPDTDATATASTTADATATAQIGAERLVPILAQLEQALERAIFRIEQLERAVMTMQSHLLAASAPTARSPAQTPELSSVRLPGDFSEPKIDQGPRPRIALTWIPIYHAREKGGCGGIAQCVSRRVSRTEPARRDLLRVFDASHPEKGWHVPDPTSVARCASCSDPIDPHGPTDLDWSAMFDDPGEDPSTMMSTRMSTQAPRLLTPDADHEQADLLRAAMGAARAAGIALVPPS